MCHLCPHPTYCRIHFFLRASTKIHNQPKVNVRLSISRNEHEIICKSRNELEVIILSIKIGKELYMFVKVFLFVG